MKPLQYKVTHWTLDPITQQEQYEPLTDENGNVLIFDTEQDARAQAMLLMERQGLDPYSAYFSDIVLVGHASPEAKRRARYKTLHKTLYDLEADFTKDTNCSPSETPITVLLEWCQQQTGKPGPNLPSNHPSDKRRAHSLSLATAAVALIPACGAGLKLTWRAGSAR